MLIEDRLRERLKKVEALYFGATTAGERDAAEAAERLKAKLEEACRRDPPIEMKFSLPDQWSVRLFIAFCRRYGIRPFRYPRQRSTTIMGRAPLLRHRGVAAVFWPAHGPLALFRADDGAVDPGGYPRRYCRRRNDGRTGQPAMTRIMLPPWPVRVRLSNSTPEDRTARRCRLGRRDT
jgi:hypothetical protein